MAFGNATKGYVRSHAGGGTTDYEALLNKPSINGVELLGDKLVGSLSGNIQVKLSDIANTNLSNVQNAQTLLYNALSQKWENGAAGGITRTQLNQTPITTTGSTGINIGDYKYIEVVSGVYAGGVYQVFSNIVSVDALTSNFEMICGGVHPTDPSYGINLLLSATNNVLNVVTLVSKKWGETATIYKIAGIK